MKSPKILKHFKCHILWSLKGLKNAYLTEYNSIHLENLTNMATSLPIIDDFLLSYVS